MTFVNKATSNFAKEKFSDETAYLSGKSKSLIQLDIVS